MAKHCDYNDHDILNSKAHNNDNASSSVNNKRRLLRTTAEMGRV